MRKLILEFNHKGKYDKELKNLELDVENPSFTARIKNTDKYSIAEKSKIAWIWSLASKKGLHFTKDDYHKTVNFGKISDNFTIDKIYYGGGIGWLEAFVFDEGPTNKPGTGIFVTTKGSPRVLFYEWREYSENNDGHPIGKREVQFGETIQLHIYTENLYGERLEIILYDDEYRNQDLPIHEKKSDHWDTEKGPQQWEAIEKSSLPKSFKSLHREVKAFHQPFTAEFDCHKLDKNGKLFVQKSVIDLYIDPVWSFSANNGGDLSKKIGLCARILYKGEKLKPKFPDGIFKDNEPPVIVKGGEFTGFSKLDPTGNKPVLVDEIETNVAVFQPCKYSIIEGIYNGKKTEIFNYSNNSIPTDQLVYQVLATNVEKDLLVTMTDLDTVECRYIKDISKSHAVKENAIQIAPKDVSKFKALAIGTNTLKFSTSYPKISNAELKNAVWLPNLKPITYLVNMNSCAFQLPLKIEVLPDIYFEMGAKFNTENPFFSGQTEAYTKRPYLKKGGFFSRSTNEQIRERQQTARSENYKNQKQDIKDGILAYKEVEIAFEYGYGEIKQEEFIFSGEHPIVSIVDSFMWIVNTMTKLCFSKEADEAETEHRHERGGQVRRRNESRNKYLDSIGKKINKFPFKIEIVQPTFAIGAKWKLEPSEKEQGKLGTLFDVKLKADPLIEIKGSLDLLFVATKIPYVGQAIQAVTAAVDTVGSADDFWNKVVDLFGGNDKYKIKIDVDYYLDLFVSGNIKLEASALKIHTIDGFKEKEIEVSSEIKFGVECGGNFKAKVGDLYSLEAEFSAKVDARWIISMNTVTDILQCKYQGMYVEIVAKIKSTSNSNNNNRVNTNDQPPQKFLLHDGFKYEFKLD